ncbi:bifunctional SulP family inorganic anion transporter/carbonic anhydrase [Amycolatopsis acidiphila]|uniref:carbonic anhydrase n=1 Tax=Amycolatopsis acidiphila TaxID=715473 RepID=A0A558A1T4_9PSEU|nr:bifunctional SulP family inorganic anion transporter/carbonic anhydrase [Amycolatopsis acidiphila]TVT18223.1 carbonic anhydrase [Amycolatopsis acidiphila]UIJ58437.1 bifunctional SulP family inorganic anion transporter/carbonic anhydrase [Amycolatopsis acidiphila]GHG93294.1 carbonic anhydrase [Amycolatopsis acidiphila]
MISTAREREHAPPGPGGRRHKAWDNLRYDIPASLVVFLVAVPLSLGIALASGAPVVAGLVAAIAGGVVAGSLGGSPLQVSGPAAGLTVIMAETINEFGWAVTCAITVLAGALQILLGLSRVARAALAASPAVVHGMLAGIGVTIVVAQVHVVLGGSAWSSPVDNLVQLPRQLLDPHGAATLIGVLTIAILLLWDRLPAAVRRVPGPLAAIVAVTVLSAATGLPVPRVEVPADVLDLRFVPRLPAGGWWDFGVAVVTVALVTSVASLLSAVATDKMHTGPRADLNRELIGQGAANMASGALGGLPVAGVIVRSSTNVQSGARTRASAVLHGLWILLFVAVLAGLLSDIPLAALAGLLVHVGAKLVKFSHIKDVLRHGDLPVYLVTLGGVVLLDLLTGVLLGIGLAALVMLRRLLWSGIHAERDEDGWRVVVEGALSALSIPRLSTVLAEVPRGTRVTLELVVDYLDHAAFDTLSAWQHSHEQAGGTVVVDEVGHPWFERGKAGEPTVRKTGARPVLPRWFAPWSQWQREQEEVVPHVPEQRGRESSMRRGMVEFERRTAQLVRPILSRLADVHEPQTLFITCGDARIVPNLITSSGPGDLFTIRNIGNLVPDHASCAADASVGASLEFAVDVLKVREIVVCGHSSCGAMKALLEGAPDDAPALRSWLRHAEPSVARARANAPLAVAGEMPAGADQLALHNVLEQLARLREYPAIARAEARGDVELCGMYFDVGAARVHLYDAGTGSFGPVRRPMSTGK